MIAFAPDGYVQQDITVEDSLPALGPPLAVKIIDGAGGQNNMATKLKYRKARWLLYYIQGDTSKLAQPNDQTPNKTVVDFIQRGSARYNTKNMLIFCSFLDTICAQDAS